jgi:hypothetical protein
LASALKSSPKPTPQFLDAPYPYIESGLGSAA